MAYEVFRLATDAVSSSVTHRRRVFCVYKIEKKTLGEVSGTFSETKKRKKQLFKLNTFLVFEQNHSFPNFNQLLLVYYNSPMPFTCFAFGQAL